MQIVVHAKHVPVLTCDCILANGFDDISTDSPGRFSATANRQEVRIDATVEFFRRDRDNPKS